MRKKHKVSYIRDHDIMTSARQSDSSAVQEALEVLRTLTILAEGPKLNNKWNERDRILSHDKQLVRGIRSPLIKISQGYQISLLTSTRTSRKIK